MYVAAIKPLIPVRSRYTTASLYLKFASHCNRVMPFFVVVGNGWVHL